MRKVSTFQELGNTRQLLSGSVGLVPTMGYLHEGHLSLIRQARAECEHVIVSIFVNPTQFGPQEDLSKYPRDLGRDFRLIEPYTDVVWTPDEAIMYPAGFQTWVQVEQLTQKLEGARRPGHFRGVTTVVAKLFNGVQPHRAYFGQKDAQQVAVIRQMCRDLNFPIEIVICPTTREADGLAMSSRNVYLSPEQRQAAPVLFRALTAARDAYAGGGRRGEQLRQIMSTIIQAEPLAQLQYVSCADYDTLEELEVIKDKALLSMAVFFGQTRLIDNVVLGGDSG